MAGGARSIADVPDELPEYIAWRRLSLKDSFDGNRDDNSRYISKLRVRFDNRGDNLAAKVDVCVLN